MATFILSPDGRADQADGIAKCLTCGSVDGPFVLVVEHEIMVLTNNGPQQLHKPLQLCAPKYDAGVLTRQGCVGTIAGLIGYVDRAELETLQEDIARRANAIRELERELEEARAATIRVVPVDDLVEMFRGASSGR